MAVTLPAKALGNADWTYLCSAFFITTDGYIASAAHCVSHNKSLSVEYKGQTYKAILVNVDYRNDVSLWKISAINTPMISMGTPLRTDEDVYVLGYPTPDYLGYNLKIHHGHVSSQTNGSYNTTASSCEGNSGGVVVNSSNQAIGVLTAGYGDSRCSNETYVVKIYYIQRIAAEAGVHYNPELRGLDKSQGMIYNQDIDSVVILYKGR